jgi:hypothetical protein
MLFKTADFPETVTAFTATVLDRCSTQAATLRCPARSARWPAMSTPSAFCISVASWGALVAGSACGALVYYRIGLAAISFAAAAALALSAWVAVTANHH